MNSGTPDYAFTFGRCYPILYAFQIQASYLAFPLEQLHPRHTSY